MLGKIEIKQDNTVISCTTTTNNQQILSQNTDTFIDPSSVIIHMGLYIKLLLQYYLQQLIL